MLKLIAHDFQIQKKKKKGIDFDHRSITIYAC